MNISRTGVILNTEQYDECVDFYRKVFELKILFQQVDGDFRLTCLEFGAAYLMIETGGFASTGGKSVSQNATKLRFNVTDINIALKKLTVLGIDAEVTRNDWGSTINLFDPDGNRIGIRDEAGFANQIIN
jgi:lactoylglutathione lyase